MERSRQSDPIRTADDDLNAWRGGSATRPARETSRLGSGALEAEARQTRIYAYLSAILLAGLGLNAWLGWWWADPAAGLLMVPLIAWEGWETVRGRTCCD